MLVYKKSFTDYVYANKEKCDCFCYNIGRNINCCVCLRTLLRFVCEFKVLNFYEEGDYVEIKIDIYGKIFELHGYTIMIV